MDKERERERRKYCYSNESRYLGEGMSLSLMGNIRKIIYIVSAKMITFNVVHGRVVPMIYFFNYLKHIRKKVGGSHCCSILFANMLLSLQNKRISNTVCIIKHYYCDSRCSNFSMVNIQTTLIIHEMELEYKFYPH